MRWLAGLLAAPLLAQKLLSFADVIQMPPPAADFRISYGSHPLQYADLRLPRGAGPHPVAIVVHGGCWRASINLDNIALLAAALARDGVATWSIEYRRVGGEGGWPNTFLDVAAAVDALRAAAARHPLDLRRVIVLGHSAGGHLALWTAARHKLKPGSPLHRPDPLPVRGVVSLAGVPDLRAAAGQVCGDVIRQLADGHYAETSPADLLPLGVPQRLLSGERDGIVRPEWGAQYEAAAKKAEDPVSHAVLPGAGHFELVVPSTPAYAAVKEAVLSLLR